MCTRMRCVWTCGSVYLYGRICVPVKKRSTVGTSCGSHDSIALTSCPLSFPKPLVTRLCHPLLAFYVATSVEYVKRMMNRPYYARTLLLADLMVSFICDHNTHACIYTKIETSKNRGEHDVNFTLHYSGHRLKYSLCRKFSQTLTIIYDVYFWM